TLVDMYCKCGDLNEAEKIFLNSKKNQDSITHTAMMKGYLDHGEGKKAFELYQEIMVNNFKLDDVAYTLGLNSCAAIQNIEEGKEIHNIINNDKNLKNNIILQNTLIDMYCKCEDLNEAEKIFLTSTNKNCITYNSMMKGYLD